MRKNDLNRAIDFVHTEGRVLERRILEATFEGRSPEPVTDALRGYQNDDGGFGYGLEPDKRASASQPLDVEIAWQSLDWAGITPVELVNPAGEYLASLGAGVSCISSLAQGYAHAPHWHGASSAPALIPTAGLAGYLWKWSIDHPWRQAATAFCWSALSDGPPDEAHTAIGLLRFLQYVPDQQRARAVVEALRPQLQTMTLLHYTPGAEGYGVSPLQLVPAPESPWTDLFPSDIIDGHLDELEKTQTGDGGWEITWPTIGPAAVSEWRGRVTLQNLLVLRAYGRVG